MGAYGLATESYRSKAEALAQEKKQTGDELARLEDQMQNLVNQMQNFANQMQLLINQHQLRIEVPAEAQTLQPRFQPREAMGAPVEQDVSADPMSQYLRLRGQHERLGRQLKALKDRYESVETELRNLDSKSIEKPSAFSAFGSALSGWALTSAAFPLLVASVLWTTGLVLITAGICWLALIERVKPQESLT
jgi:hypothetical protein